MHAICDKTRGNGPVNAKSGRLSSGSLAVWSSLAWAIVIALSYTGCGAHAQENSSILKPNDAILWSAEDARNWASAGCSCVGTVGADGMLNLGAYGSVRVAGLTLTDAKAAISRQIALSKSRSGLAQPDGHAAQSYVLKESDVLVWSVGNGSGGSGSPASGRCQVDRDGMVSLGRYGSIKVAGLTYEQAKAAIQKHLADSVEQRVPQLRANEGERAKPMVASSEGSRPRLLNYASATAGNEASASTTTLARVGLPELPSDQAGGSDPALFLPASSAPGQPNDAASASLSFRRPILFFRRQGRGRPVLLARASLRRAVARHPERPCRPGDHVDRWTMCPRS